MLQRLLPVLFPNHCERTVSREALPELFKCNLLVRLRSEHRFIRLKSGNGSDERPAGLQGKNGLEQGSRNRIENMNSTTGLMNFALLLVGLGGAIGSIARFAIGNWLVPWLVPGNFNLSTTAVNVVGSFLLGCLAANFPDRSKSLYLLLGVGFCGGFTTFSTFSLELLEALMKGNPMSGILHCLANVFLGLAAVFLGFVLFRAA